MRHAIAVTCDIGKIREQSQRVCEFGHDEDGAAFLKHYGARYAHLGNHVAWVDILTGDVKFYSR